MDDTEDISIAEICADGGTQTRSVMRMEVIDEYAAALKAGTDLPPLIVFVDHEEHCYWLADGFHRLEAHKRNGSKLVPCKVVTGDRRAALLYALGSNSAHGLQRSSEDKRRCVELCLDDPEWANASNRWIADACKVSEHLVRTIRPSKTKEPQKVSEDASTAPGRSSSNQASEREDNKRVGRDGKARSSPTKEKKPTVPKPKKKGDAAHDRPPDAPLDSFRNVIPKPLRDAYCDPWIQDTLDYLAEWGENFRMAKLGNGMNKRGKRYPFFKQKDFIDGVGFVIQYLDSLTDHLKEMRPAGVCPSCRGDKCPDCRQSGLVPKTVYENLM